MDNLPAKIMFFCLLKWQMTLISTKMNYCKYESIHIFKNIILIQNDRIIRQKETGAFLNCVLQKKSFIELLTSCLFNPWTIFHVGIIAYTEKRGFFQSYMLYIAYKLSKNLWVFFCLLTQMANDSKLN